MKTSGNFLTRKTYGTQESRTSIGLEPIKIIIKPRRKKRLNKSSF